jgi:proteasome lid subunit RPN8/RPN11
MLTISERALHDILSHAREEAPRECCGLLVGTGDTVVRSVRARNLEASATRYLIDPGDHFKAIRAARTEGLDIVGAYHSHPASAPVPSPTDISQAENGPDFLYLIVSPSDGDHRVFRIDAGTVRPVPFSARRDPDGTS